MKWSHSLLYSVVGSLLSGLILALLGHLVGFLGLDEPIKNRLINGTVIGFCYLVIIVWSIYVWRAKRQSQIIPSESLYRYGKITRYVSLFILISALTVGLWSFLPIFQTDRRESMDVTELWADGSVEIVDIKLLDATLGQFPYNDRILLRFILSGNYSIEKDPKDYSFTVFYKNLSDPSQRYGWFCVLKLDSKGFEQPNLIPLNELSRQRWEYVTSRLFINKELEPTVAFIVLLLPNSLIKKQDLVDDNLGWGIDSLDFLKNRPGVVCSKIKIYKGSRRSLKERGQPLKKDKSNEKKAKHHKSQ